MPDLAPKAELLRSLGRLVRGLSALFWGLPLSLLVCVRTAMSEWLRPLGMLPPVLATGLLLYGLLQLGCFQKQERIWRNALDRAVLLAIVNIGLAPFIYWWNRLPGVSYYGLGVAVLVLSSLLFLFNLNYVLQRLAAMLPDETLRVETTLFGNLNLYLLCAVLFLVSLYFALHEISALPIILIQLLQLLELGRQWLLVFLVLLPVAMTMTLIWKIKEVILASVFGED
ncbi:MAG: hypothetical protein JWM99_1852 [Verrucomicrobiales bacterium]|jgi:hypothetical protein|nr:hypothetical protein [Verrucomicrobiales bacterium]